MSLKPQSQLKQLFCCCQSTSNENYKWAEIIAFWLAMIKGPSFLFFCFSSMKKLVVLTVWSNHNLVLRLLVEHQRIGF
jgi:hypothetical protein